MSSLMVCFGGTDNEKCKRKFWSTSDHSTGFVHQARKPEQLKPSTWFTLNTAATFSPYELTQQLKMQTEHSAYSETAHFPDSFIQMYWSKTTLFFALIYSHNKPNLAVHLRHTRCCAVCQTLTFVCLLSLYVIFLFFCIAVYQWQEPPSCFYTWPYLVLILFLWACIT